MQLDCIRKSRILETKKQWVTAVQTITHVIIGRIGGQAAEGYSMA